METRGRKKLPKGEKKVPVTVYPKQREIDSVGGMDKAKKIALQSIKNGAIQK